MKKIIIVFLILVFMLCVVIVFANLWDGPEPNMNLGKAVNVKDFNSFAKSIGKEPSFDYNNGFYRFYTLIEPPDADIESEEVLLKIRRLHDPQFDNPKYREEWEKEYGHRQDKEGYFGRYIQLKEQRKKILETNGTFDSWSGSKNRDWAQFLSTKKEAAHQLLDLYHLFLERYKKIVHSEVIEEFTAIDPLAPLPNLLLWLHLGRLYSTECMLEALEGNWESAIDHLFDHINFTKKTLRYSRTLIFNLVGKAMMKESLRALASLMNQPEFPKALYQHVIDQMPPLPYEEFGTRVPLLLEGYVMLNVKDTGFFFQENRTRQYCFDFLAHFVNSERIPPYRWKSDPKDYKVLTNGLFWWIQNPAGKKKYEELVSSKNFYNLFVTMFKAYSVKAVYDMTRISAELHQIYQPGEPVQATLNKLKTYLTWLDPGSGKPYKWHQQKQMLYSFGVDCDDDDGRQDYTSVDTDIHLPVILYIK